MPKKLTNIGMQKQKPFRSKKYTDWVKSQPSILSGLPADDPHHIKGVVPSGTVKPDDIFCIPLTREEHTELHQIGWKTWERKYGLTQSEAAALTIQRAIHEGVIEIVVS